MILSISTRRALISRTNVPIAAGSGFGLRSHRSMVRSLSPISSMRA